MRDTIFKIASIAKKYSQLFKRSNAVIRYATFMFVGFMIGAGGLALANPGNIREKAQVVLGIKENATDVKGNETAANDSDLGKTAPNTSPSTNSDVPVKDQSGNSQSNGENPAPAPTPTPIVPAPAPTPKPQCYIDNGDLGRPPCPATPKSSFGSNGGICSINASAATVPCPPYEELIYILPTGAGCEFMWPGQVYKRVPQTVPPWPTCSD